MPRGDHFFVEKDTLPKTYLDCFSVLARFTTAASFDQLLFGVAMLIGHVSAFWFTSIIENCRWALVVSEQKKVGTTVFAEQTTSFWNDASQQHQTTCGFPLSPPWTCFWGADLMFFFNHGCFNHRILRYNYIACGATSCFPFVMGKNHRPTTGWRKKNPDFKRFPNGLNWLVVWNINFMFPYIGCLIIPSDFHIFQRAGPTTNQ